MFLTLLFFALFSSLLRLVQLRGNSRCDWDQYSAQKLAVKFLILESYSLLDCGNTSPFKPPPHTIMTSKSKAANVCHSQKALALRYARLSPDFVAYEGVRSEHDKTEQRIRNKVGTPQIREAV